MLLKASDGAGGWIFFDRVDKIHLLAPKHAVESSQELEELDTPSGVERINLVPKDSFPTKNGALRVGALEFVRLSSNLRHRVFYSEVVYICNDEGDTIERLNIKKIGR